MPREITKLVYTYAELGETEKARAIESVQDMLSRTWGDFGDIEAMGDTLVYCLAGELHSPGWDTFGEGDFPGIDGVTMSGWDLDRGDHLSLSGTLTRENAPALPWLDGVDVIELGEIRPHGGTAVNAVATDEAEESWSHKTTYAEVIAAWVTYTEPLRNAVRDAMHAALKAGRDDLDYQTSAEYAREWIDVSEPEFTESGDLT